VTAVRRTAALLALLLTAALTAPAAASASAAESAPTGAVDRPDTSSRVLLQLDIAFTPPGLLTATGRNAQSERLAVVRRQALSRVSVSGARALRTYERLPYVAVEASTSALRALRSAAEVAAVLPDELFRPSLASSGPVVGAPQAWSAGFTGAGHTVAVIDSGVESGHAFLAGKVVDEACFSSGGGCPNGADTQVGAGAAAPCTFDEATCPHGTHVAGIVAGSGSTSAGVARAGSIAAVQVFSRSTSGCPQGASVCAVGRTSDLLAGMDHIATLSRTRPVAAVNLSLGGGSYTGSCDSSQAALKAAIDTLRSLGVATVVATGNAGTTSAISSPACISTAVAVGSTSLTDVVSPFSNSSPELDLLAPGERILSSYTSGRYAYSSGTSQATPHVAGAFAVLRHARPDATVSQLVSALIGSGKPVLDTRNGRTTPRLQVDAAVKALQQQFAVAPAPAPAPTSAPAPAPAPAPQTEPSSTRLSGTDRYETAARIFGAAFGCGQGGTASAVLARGDAFADALAGSYLAGSRDTGVLLTSTGSVPAATLSALRDSGAGTVYLLGGVAAISHAVADQLAGTPSYACDGMRGADLKVVRVSGVNRFDTARRTAEQPGAGAVGTADLGSGTPLRTAIVASGLGFADALAAGPLSYGGAGSPAQGDGRGFPTLLTSPDALAPEAEAALSSLGIEQVIVPGGTAVVSPAVVSRLQALDIRVVRLAGSNRTETAAIVAQFGVDRLGFSSSAVTLARGDAFADALAGGAYSGNRAVPLLLTAGPTKLGEATRAYLHRHSNTTPSVTAFGGDGAISAATLAEAVDALQS
jgi:subtilisin family serine protease